MKKRDLILLAVGAGILFFLYKAPPATTARVPDNSVHSRIYDVFSEEGKKAAGTLCVQCHNPDSFPLPEKHPSKNRCLFCHKLEAK